MTWYAAKPDIGGLPSPPLPQGADEIRVPLNRAGFEKYRNMSAVTATMGATMTVAFCGFPALLLYILLVDPTKPNPALAVPGALLSLALPLFVGAATLPSLSLARTLGGVLKRNLPALVVSREGVWDYSSNYVFGFIAWSEIESVVSTSRHSRQLDRDFLGVAFVVKNKTVLLRRKPRMFKFWLNQDPEIAARRQVFIPQGRIGVPVEDLVRRISEFRQNSQEKRRG